MIADGLQYANWSRSVFEEMRAGGVGAVHATVAYHGNFREAVSLLSAWNRRFDEHGDLIMPARSGADVREAQRSGRTAIVLGAQNPSLIEDDIGLIEALHRLGLRFMQLTYNNQSLLACGCAEAQDSGVTRMGREAIAEMNRLGLAIDLSHAAERSTLEAIDLSARPVAITHANPASWHNAARNVSDAVLKRLAARGGMIGFSLYPHHLKGGSHCAIADFAAMVARTAELIGTRHLGIGSDLCQDQPHSVVNWMRDGRWKRPPEAGGATFPPPLPWFQSNRDFGNIAQALTNVGFNSQDTAAIMGENWMRFFDESFGPQA